MQLCNIVLVNISHPCFTEEGTTRTDLLSSLDSEDPVARALFKMIDEKVQEINVCMYVEQH